nr:MAG TPA: hypothetical protein [Caudoviricetes sp.]
MRRLLWLSRMPMLFSRAANCNMPSLQRNW